ncbi:SDR family oxidoreductase [Bacillus sp. S3]|nr:SDR family oxidoreductase [Bacillus sp. S3]
MLSGRTAIITGGGSGLGTGIAQALGEAGANIVLGDINQEALENATASLKDMGIDVIGVYMDITQDESIESAFQCAIKQFGGIDILVNNAGITKLQNIFDITTKDWDMIFNLNVRAMFSCSQLFASQLFKDHKPGRIVNIASNAGKVSYIGQAHYNASKAAVINLTQSLAKEFAPMNINVNAVCPGAVDTEMLRKLMVQTVQESAEAISVETLRETWGPPQLGRLIQPIEVGRVIAFLASDSAEIIRGQSISVDGGNTPY